MGLLASRANRRERVSFSGFAENETPFLLTARAQQVHI
jgi:hypothetical protein